MDRIYVDFVDNISKKRREYDGMCLNPCAPTPFQECRIEIRNVHIILLNFMHYCFLNRLKKNDDFNFLMFRFTLFNCIFLFGIASVLFLVSLT